MISSDYFQPQTKSYKLTTPHPEVRGPGRIGDVLLLLTAVDYNFPDSLCYWDPFSVLHRTSTLPVDDHSAYCGISSQGILLTTRNHCYTYAHFQDRGWPFYTAQAGCNNSPGLQGYIYKSYCTSTTFCSS